MKERDLAGKLSYTENERRELQRQKDHEERESTYEIEQLTCQMNEAAALKD